MYEVLYKQNIILNVWRKKYYTVIIQKKFIADIRTNDEVFHQNLITFNQIFIVNGFTILNWYGYGFLHAIGFRSYMYVHVYNFI